MAKKKLGDLVSDEKQPTKTPIKPKELGRTISVGVGLKEGEVSLFDDMAGELGITRNAIMAWALRHFLKQYQAGAIDLPIETETKRKLSAP